jgi:hypothetical protein
MEVSVHETQTSASALCRGTSMTRPTRREWRCVSRYNPPDRRYRTPACLGHPRCLPFRLPSSPPAVARGRTDRADRHPAPKIVLKETLADQADSISWSDRAILTVAQSTATFTGTLKQTGACVGPNSTATVKGASSNQRGPHG